MSKYVYSDKLKSTGLHIDMTQQEATKAPSKSDYAETKRLLRDFCIPIKTIPQFEHRSELFRWRLAAIADGLC